MQNNSILTCAKKGYRPLLSSGRFLPSEKKDVETLFQTYKNEKLKTWEQNPAGILIPQGDIHRTGRAIFSVLADINTAATAGIILIAQVHREFCSTVWLPDYKGFDTPFRRFSTDSELIKELAARDDNIIINSIPFEEEPCFDIPLCIFGFLGYFGPVLPVLAGSESHRSGDSLKMIKNICCKERQYMPVYIDFPSIADRHHTLPWFAGIFNNNDSITWYDESSVNAAFW